VVASWRHVSPVEAAVLVVGVLGAEEWVDGGILFELTLGSVHSIVLVKALLNIDQLDIQ
jgi:hypothetical protein